MPPKKIPKKYTAGLVGKEREAQIKSIREGKPRPKTSAKSKQSPATTAFKKKYGDITKLSDIARATGIPLNALKDEKEWVLIIVLVQDLIKLLVVGEPQECIVL